MNIHSLTYFAIAAKHLSFTRAAEECLIEQSAMSRQISGIEKELGVKLFTRFNKRVELTRAGESFYREVLDILQCYSSAVYSARNIESGLNEALSIGFGIYDAPLVTAPVKTFTQLNPNVKITINQYPYDKLITSLTDGSCGIVFCPANATDGLKNISTIPVKTACISIIVSDTNPLARKSVIEAKDLEQQVFIVQSDDSAKYSAVFNAFCAREGFLPKMIISANTLEALLTLVEAGFGFACVPDYLEETVNHKIRFKPLINRNKLAHVVASLKSDDNKAVKNFMKMSGEHYRINLKPGN